MSQSGAGLAFTWAVQAEIKAFLSLAMSGRRLKTASATAIVASGHTPRRPAYSAANSAGGGD